VRARLNQGCDGEEHAEETVSHKLATLGTLKAFADSLEALILHPLQTEATKACRNGRRTSGTGIWGGPER
jgi:hypothetical protein